MVWSVFFGLIIGMISATKRNKWQDHAGMALAVSGISFPTFALGLLLMEIFSVSLGWLPTVGADSWKHYILPSITLGAGVAAVMARFTRASFVEILQDDYIRTARAKGLSEWAVIVKHGLRNALIPVVTMMGLQFGFLLGGSIVVEKVFNWPGLGRLLVDAVEMRDYPVLQAEVLLFSLEFILINLLVDILYAVINPRICFKRYEYAKQRISRIRPHKSPYSVERILAQVQAAAHDAVCGQLHWPVGSDRHLLAVACAL